METSNNFSAPLASTQNISPQLNKKPLYIFLLVITILLVGVVGYYLGTRSASSKQTSVISPSPVKTNSPVVTSPPAVSPVTNTLPAGWSYKNNNECDVEFAIPPKEHPYYRVPNTTISPPAMNDVTSGRFWDFPRGVTYSPLLGKLSTDPEYKDIKPVITMFASEDDASGYIPAAVSVHCLANTANLSNTQLLNELMLKLESFNKETGEKGMQPLTYRLESSKEVRRWGKEVLDLSVMEVYGADSAEPSAFRREYTIFATPKFLYEIKIVSMTDDQFVKDTAKQIFELLRFK